MWDHLAFVWGPPSADPWVTLAAVAAATEPLTLGTAVTPLPRRRPQVVAQQLATLEALNGGRVVLGAGLGGNEKEFTAFGEDFDPHRRARLLDDGLRSFASTGPARSGSAATAVRRCAAPRAGTAGSRTASRSTGMTMTPDELARKVETIGRGAGFDVACNGYSSPATRRSCADYADAGATWWLENLHDRPLRAGRACSPGSRAGPART